MSRIIAHRRNTIDLLKKTTKKYGIEVDIRSHKNQLIIHHDPYVEGEDFETWLTHYDHGTLILNVKEEGLEEQLLSLMQKFNIHDFFFLDQSFPFLIKWAKRNERRCAVRISEFESIETAITLQGKIDWAWVDYFTQFPLTTSQAHQLQKAGFKLCLVSPELQGYTADIEIPKLQDLLKEQNIIIDAVCTKYPEQWEASFYDKTH